MTTFVDDFNRADTTSGLGTIPGSGLAWELSGVARIASQRPVFVADRNQRPAAVVDTGGNDADITIRAGGGDAVYLRWVDSSNWVSARIRRYTTTVSTTTMEYEYRAPTYDNTTDAPTGGYHTSWTSGNYPGYPIGSSINGVYSRQSEATRTGRSRVGSVTSTVTRYQLIVEQSVGGVVTAVPNGTVTISTPLSLRARVQGTTLQLYLNGSATAAVAVNSTVHRGATRHGFGLGPSEVAASALDAVTIDTLNDAPYAPTLEYPVGVAVDRTSTIRFRFRFNDPNPGDAQSGFEFRCRSQNASAWQPADVVTSPNGFYDLPAGTFPAGTWEWSVRTRDSGGREGPWAPSEFFIAATPVETHTITTPGAGEVIGAQERLVEWSTPDQDAYRLQVLSAAASGVAGTTVYVDTGWTSDPDARSRVLPFDVNGVMVVIRLRVMADGLESAPVDSFHPVSWLGPREPVAMLDIDTPEGAITITAADPPPFGDHPAVVDHYLELRTATEVVGGVPVFAGDWSRWRLRPPQVIPANGSYKFWDNGHGEHYEFRWAAVGANGTTSYSAPVSEQWTPPVTYAFDPTGFDPAVFDTDEVGGDQPPSSTGFGVQPFGTSPFGG